MAEFGTFSLGNVLQNVDAIKTARLQQQLGANALKDAERQRAEEAQLGGARSAAWNGDISHLVGLRPQEAIAIQQHFQSMGDRERAEAAAEAQEELETMGRIAAWVKGSADPAAAWAKVQQNLPEEMRAGMPAQYDPDFVDFTLARLMSIDQLIEQAKSGQAQARFADALGGGGGGQPQGQPGVETVPGSFIRSELVKRGLPEHVAEGFVLNMQDESGLRPGVNEQNPTVKGSRGGFGLYQLTGPRRAAYEQWAAQSGRELADPSAQLDFLVAEMQGPERAAAEKIMQTSTPGEAASAIATYFLRPAPEHLAARVARYGGAPAGGGTPAPQGDPAQMIPALEMLYADPSMTAPMREIIAARIEAARGPGPQSPEAKLYADEQAGLVPPGTFGQPDASAAEESIARLMEAGLDRDTAIGIVDGRLAVTRDPVTGVAQVVDKATGQVLGAEEAPMAGQMPAAPVDPAAPAEGPSTSVMPQVDYTGATGAQGFVSSIANTVSEIAQGGLIAPENERAHQALSNLHVRTQVALAGAVAGRPSNYLLEQFDRMAVTPGSLFQGPGRARERLAQTRDMLDEAIAENVDVGRSGVTPQMKAEANANIQRLRRLRDDYNAVIESFGDRGTGGNATDSGVRWRVIE